MIVDTHKHTQQISTQTDWQTNTHTHRLTDWVTDRHRHTNPCMQHTPSKHNVHAETLNRTASCVTVESVNWNRYSTETFHPQDIANHTHTHLHPIFGAIFYTSDHRLRLILIHNNTLTTKHQMEPGSFTGWWCLRQHTPTTIVSRATMCISWLCWRWGHRGRCFQSHYQALQNEPCIVYNAQL